MRLDIQWDIRNDIPVDIGMLSQVLTIPIFIGYFQCICNSFFSVFELASNSMVAISCLFFPLFRIVNKTSIEYQLSGSRMESINAN